MSNPILEVRDLRVGYGKVEALHGASIRVQSGQIVTVIGPNGAGKSTMLNAIMGCLPGRGEVVFQGQNMGDLAIERRVAWGMSLVPETRELFGSMSVADNLLLGSYPRYRTCSWLCRSDGLRISVVPAVAGTQETGCGDAFWGRTANAGGG